MTSDTYRQESRADLEERFRLIAQFALAARGKASACTRSPCGCCLLLGEAFEIPLTVRERAHEPREDLELACERVVERLTTVAEHKDAQACPAGGWLRDLLSTAAERDESA